jgi:hypothetical protein
MKASMNDKQGRTTLRIIKKANAAGVTFAFGSMAFSFHAQAQMHDDRCMQIIQLQQYMYKNVVKSQHQLREYEAVMLVVYGKIIP